MFLGALIDAGVPAKIFEDAVSVLAVGARLEISRVNRSGISAAKVDVIVEGEKDSPRDASAELSGRTGMSDPHGHSHSHEHSHTHAETQHGVHHFSPVLGEVGVIRALTHPQ